MDKPKGGRGKRAPYSTCIIRIPEALKRRVEILADDYISAALAEVELFDRKDANAVTLVTYAEALQQSKQMLKGKKSASKTVAKLLQLLYGGDEQAIEKIIKST
jgi:hypothetical protein